MTVKAIWLVPRNACKEMIPNADTEQMLASGSYVEAKPRPRSNRAAAMRALRRERQAEGWLSVKFWLTPDEVAAVSAELHPGETYSGLLMRLILERGSSFDKPEVQTDK